MTLATTGRTNRPATPATAPKPPAVTDPQIDDTRSTEMYLIHEELARAHMAQRQREAERIRLARRIASARRAQRKAEQAVLRARVAVLSVSYG
jgi:uncharacterized protein YlxW (UPF0749 family)